MPKVGIIGSGLSSLYVACALAKAGFSVDVFEKNSTAGGRSRVFEANGFKFDMGPSWYWMPDLIDYCFESLGENREDYFKLERLQNAYQVFWKDDKSTIVPADKKALIDLFESFELNGGQKLESFLKQAEEKYQIAKPLMELPGKKLSEVLRKDILKNIFRMDVFKSVDKDVSNRFSSNKARSILNFPVLFLGEMPNKIPALYTLMNHADLNLGTWYPEGGMSAIAVALEKIALENNVTFHFNAPVQKIESDGTIATGLKVNDSSYNFDFIVSGADYHFTEQFLLTKKDRRYTESYWQKRKLAPSSLIYYLGINKRIKNLEHHNLFFDEDLTAHGKTIYENIDWPEKPLFYTCAPSKTDKDVAPEGSENLFLLMPISTELEDNEEIREQYLDKMLKRIEIHTGEEISNHIEFKKSFCIEDFKTEYNSFKGNAYGLANTLGQTANLKPKLHSKLSNLFFCGQLTVPGPGVPPALLSGKIAAEQIINSYEKDI